MKNNKDLRKAFVDCFNEALPDVRVIGAIAHACELALFSKEAVNYESLGYALAYAYEASQRVVKNLETMDEIRNKGADLSFRPR